MCIVTVLSHGLRSGGGVGDVLRKPSKEVAAAPGRARGPLGGGRLGLRQKPLGCPGSSLGSFPPFWPRGHAATPLSSQEAPSLQGRVPQHTGIQS